MRRVRTIDPGSGGRRISLAATGTVDRPSEMRRTNDLRAALYRSPRWRRERRAFLRHNPVCVTAGCSKPAVVVDHRDGHQRQDWLASFWDQRLWQPMCSGCHGAKSGRELAAWRTTGGTIPRSRP